LTAHTVHAQSIELEPIAVDGDRMTVRVQHAPVDRIRAALESGMRAEVLVVLRVFEEVEGIAGLIGDLLVTERRISRVAAYDPFREGYVVETRSGSTPSPGETSSQALPERRITDSIDAAVDRLLTLPGIELPTQELQAGEGRYLTAQARLQPLTLAEHLRIIALVLPRYSLHSGWTVLDGSWSQEGER
jgi:hypothetical protein